MRARLSTKSRRRRTGTTGIAGTANAITLSAMQIHGATPTATTPARKIWTLTAVGKKYRTMATSGFQTNLTTGHRIATETGSMNRTMDGPGSDMSLGAGRRITMAAG